MWGPTRRWWSDPSSCAGRGRAVPVGFQPRRVVEVWAPSSGSGTVGSGYLLGRGLALTAGHVAIDGLALGGCCEVRRLGTAEWLPADLGVAWRGL